MAEYITKIRTEVGDKQIDFNALANKPTVQSLGAAAVQHDHSISEITDFPDSLPANGGNADYASNAGMLDGKSSSDFASATDVEELKTKLDADIQELNTALVDASSSMQDQINDINNTMNYDNGIAYFSTPEGAEAGKIWVVEGGSSRTLVDIHGDVYFPITSTSDVQDMDSGKYLSEVLVEFSETLTEKVDESQEGMTTLLATGYTMLSSYQYGDDFPADYVHSDSTKGTVFLKKADQ